MSGPGGALLDAAKVAIYFPLLPSRAIGNASSSKIDSGH